MCKQYLIAEDYSTDDKGYCLINTYDNTKITSNNLLDYMNSIPYVNIAVQHDELVIFSNKHETVCYDVIADKKVWINDNLLNVSDYNCLRNGDFVTTTVNNNKQNNCEIVIFDIHSGIIAKRYDVKIDKTSSSNRRFYIEASTEQKNILYSDDGYYYCYDSDYKKCLWSYKAFFEGFPVGDTRISNDTLLALSTIDDCEPSTFIIAINLNDGVEKWRIKAHPVFIVMNNNLFCYQNDTRCTDDKNTYISKVSLESGNILCRFKIAKSAFDIKTLSNVNELCLFYSLLKDDKKTTNCIFLDSELRSISEIKELANINKDGNCIERNFGNIILIENYEKYKHTLRIDCYELYYISPNKSTSVIKLILDLIMRMIFRN